MLDGREEEAGLEQMGLSTDPKMDEIIENTSEEELRVTFQTN